MKAILVRHCETNRNRDRIVQGRADPPLNEEGLFQARRLADRLAGEKIDAVFSSPLARARETASTIAGMHGLEVQITPALLELDVGEMDGLTSAEMRSRFPGFLESWLAGPESTLQLPGGERLEDVQARAWAFLESLREQDGLETVVCVTHNFVLLSLVCYALNLPLLRLRRLRQSLGGFSIIDFRPNRIQIAKLNETCHLGDVDL